MNYSKYGISESYVPTVYHNKIVIDKTIASTVNDNLSQNPYINENKAFVETVVPDKLGNLIGINEFEFVDAPVGFLGNVSSESAQTLVTVNYNIAFNVPSYAEFVELTKDDDFGSAYELYTGVFFKRPGTNIDPFSTSDALMAINAKYSGSLGGIKARVNGEIGNKIALNQVFQSVAGDELNLTNFDNFTRYERKFPDGQTYFNLPYVNKFQVPLEDIQHMFLISCILIKDFDIDLSLNFGDFQIDDPLITSVSALEAYNLGTNKEGYNVGPISIDTLLANNESIKKGNLYVVSRNQGDTAREDKFNDIKGTPWLGSVHYHLNRYMAGTNHSADTNNLQPYLDKITVPNSKLIDLRPLKELETQKIDFTSQMKNIKTTKVNYFSDDSKDNLLEKLTVISEPLFSTNKQGNIDGFFSINYINFLRKRGLFSNLLENVSEFKGIPGVIQGTFKIKVLRYDSNNNSKLIFDSSRAENGIFYDKPNLESQLFTNNNTPKIPLGYLNAVNMAKSFFDINEELSLVEFYNFTDLDKLKQSKEKYKYKIEIEMVDPIFSFLSLGVRQLDQALIGDGNRLGLVHILDLIKVKKGKFSEKNKTNTNTFPYIEGDLQLTVNDTQNSTIVDFINEYDTIRGNNPPTIITQDGKTKLSVLRTLFENSQILDVLGISSELKQNSYDVIENILDLQDFGAVSIDLIQLIITTLTSIRDNLKSSVNAISNVDITTQSLGYSATGVSPQNGKFDKRIIREERLSDLTIEKQDYGFDYLQALLSADNDGLKQVLFSSMNNGYKFFNTRYYDVNNPDSYSADVASFLEQYGFSSLLLTKDGVSLPEGLATDKDLNSWSSVLQFLLLFRDKNVSKITDKTTFTYEASKGTEYEIDINSGLDTEKNLPLLKSLDRSQKQLANKGMSVPDQVASKQKLYSLFNADEKQTDENDSNAITPVNNLKTNNISNYFVSYINNAVESGNENKDKYLGGVDDSLLIQANTVKIIPSKSNQTIASVALIDYSNGVEPSGYPAGNIDVSFSQYYENNVWKPESKRILLDKYAEFFFDFIHSVRIEYLIGFDAYTYNGILANPSNLDIANNTNASQYKWQRITNDDLTTLVGLGDGFILCRMVDFIPKAFENVKIPLIEKLKFYKKYYKYFLITGRSTKDLEIKPFGSTL